MKATYGYIGHKEEYYDLSNTLKGAKISATKRGIKKVYKRMGYITVLESIKTSKGWIDNESIEHLNWIESKKNTPCTK